MKRSSVRIELVTLRAYAVRVARVCNRDLIDPVGAGEACQLFVCGTVGPMQMHAQ